MSSLLGTPPPFWLTLYHLVTRLPDSLRAVRDHFLARCPTELTIALLEKELLAAEASIVAVGASRGDPRTPFFEGCSPSPLLPSVASASAVDLLGAEKVGTASTSSWRRRGKGGKGGGGDGGGGGGGGGGDGGGGGGLEGLVAAVGVVAAAAGAVAGAGAAVGAEVVAEAAGQGVVEEVAAAVVVVEALAVARVSSTLRHPRRPVSGTFRTGGGGGGLSCTYVIRTGDRTGQTCGRPHPTQRCFSRLDDAWRTQFPDATELPRWFDLMKKGVDIYALDFDAILTAMYVMSTSGEGAQYLCVPPDPGIRTSEAAALGASETATPVDCGTAHLHT
ncbi:unnamed protein product [Closterium sp. Yama58-4]|nr:unnamed protein product [Closterium sp. Yama58-4]